MMQKWCQLARLVKNVFQSVFFQAIACLMRLKTDIAVSALLRRVQLSGAYGVVLRKGDIQAGAYMLSVCHEPNENDERYTLYISERNKDGALIWVPKGPLKEVEASKIINRRVDFDPDLWVIEIEDKQGRSFLEDVAEPKLSEAEVAAEALFQAQAPHKKG